MDKDFFKKTRILAGCCEIGPSHIKEITKLKFSI
tara:strand:- start:575 stop:676 length:102 start_codon:yes stop_codon:yes gene_type:complete